jgi:hypothetical protein
MRFLVVVLNALVVLFLVRLVLRGLASFLRPRPQGAAARKESVDMVRDRVCNTFLPRERAVRALVAGHEEHFCSAACRDRALAAVFQAS